MGIFYSGMYCLNKFAVTFYYMGMLSLFSVFIGRTNINVTISERLQ